MSVGLYDGDFLVYNKPILNLELMKLAAYYTKMREVVSLTTSFCPEKFSRYYFRKDFMDGIFPSEFGFDSKIQYGGYAFTNNIYKPLPLEIEKMQPNTEIYRTIIQKATVEDPTREDLNKYIMMQHMRLSLDGKTLWKDLDSQFNPYLRKRIFMFHDRDLGAISGSRQRIIDILNEYQNPNMPARICTKFPVVTKNYQDFIDWYEMPTNPQFSVMIDFLMTPDQTWDFSQNHKTRTFFTYYNLSNLATSGEDLLKRVLPEIFRQMIILRIKKRKILLIYDNNFLVPEGFTNLIDAINDFMDYMGRRKVKAMPGREADTMKNFCKYVVQSSDNTLYNLDKLREAFYYAYDNAPELYHLMQGGNYNKLRRCYCNE